MKASYLPRFDGGDANQKLDTIFNRCAGAYSDITLRGYRRDLETFVAWCETVGRHWLPSTPETLAAFIDYEINLVSTATLKRRLAAIRLRTHSVISEARLLPVMCS